MIRKEKLILCNPCVKSKNRQDIDVEYVKDDVYYDRLAHVALELLRPEPVVCEPQDYI